MVARADGSSRVGGWRHALPIGGTAVAAGDSLCFGQAVTITGDEDANELTGHYGDDVLQGRGGDDVLLGQGGDDTLNGGSGPNTIHGGKGTDRCRRPSAAKARSCERP